MKNPYLALIAMSAVPQLVSGQASWDSDPDTFVCTWLVTEPYENDPANAGLERDWIGEAEVRPRAGDAWRYFDDRLLTRDDGISHSSAPERSLHAMRETSGSYSR